jgi:hypothetical protein
MLEDLGLRNIEIVPVISDINTGINITRAEFASAYFDEEGCKLGFSHLENYKKRWNEKDSRWSDEPRKDHTSEGADAFPPVGTGEGCGGMITPAGTWDDDEDPDYTGRSTIGGY